MTLEKLLTEDRAHWERAVHHPFLGAVRDGTLSETAFDTWLVQDHHFVEDLDGFQERLVERAPAVCRGVLASGLVALRDELAWFEGIAERRGLDLAAPRLPGALRARDLIARLDESDVATALLGLWAIERAYLDAWSYAAPGAPGLREYVEHWTTPDFVAYVDSLARACDQTPGGDPTIVRAVAGMEHDFWAMAWVGGPATS